MQRIKINNNKLPKVKQIVLAIVAQIEKGKLLKDERLPSINEFSEQYSVARDTVEKAYKDLKEQGYIISVAAKGYFVQGKKDQRIKVLLVFNKLSSYKKMVYDSMLQTLGEKAKVDLQIHHYDPHLLKEILETSQGAYHYYVIMPHFFHGAEKEVCLSVLKMIPENELILLDKHVPELEGNHISIYQDFKWDIYYALKEAADLMKKYDRLVLVFPKYSHHPTEITEGVLQFCLEHQKGFSVVSSVGEEALLPQTAYIVITESDLALLIKKVRNSTYQLGQEIGIISFNETVFKELLDITVISTDFEEMGRSAACQILNGQVKKAKNPFHLILRKSL
ncbi:GntR family transcriptional regulator [Chitinophagaceae bacterium LB-8]|uniref:GntR family transcriptional regulator n=1 Tax=Paraflavisolibacter caeni TaxID=2982496 RepID=A0A9X2XVU0_9BACT|nr:GntR family transcriptional regulator [Paraflavisolibacter caeni]MCU7549805.1 GntR family transcriptional regulator [Paraflavisolibacter caeni]